MPPAVGVLLVNLGTPRAPTPREVRRYLREFLSDPRVLDINPIARWALVHLLIAPFRARKSAEAYQKIWTPQGSPLRVHTQALGKALAETLGDRYAVETAMRYGEPSIEGALQNLQRRKVGEIRVLPLYPQYSTSATESTQAEVTRLAKKNPALPPLRFLLPFFNHPGFIRAFAAIGEPLLEDFKPDHILFSFHGLPERHILKTDLSKSHCLHSPDCCEKIIPANGLCYRAHCFQSARAIAAQLKLTAADYTVCFQSRLGRTPWIQPYTDQVIDERLHQGHKRLAVFCPAFVADCLETLEEIGLRAREQVKNLGGEDLLLIPSLNAHPKWVEALADMFRENMG